MKWNVLLTLSLGFLFCLSAACTEDKKSEGEAGQSYDFSTATSAAIALAESAALRPNSSHALTIDGASLAGPTLCSSVLCFTPTALTGAYYGTGFLIQSGGNGMVAYFGKETWSDIVGSSVKYNFDTAAPVTNTGNLTCCGGTGDLSSENTYISDVIYLFGYLDATFELEMTAGGNTSMSGIYTVRFVLADGAADDVANGSGVIAGSKRGDVLIKIPGDTEFKWLDPNGTTAGSNITPDAALVTTRPSSPVTMDESVTSWTNPFGEGQGNQEIPVIYAPVLPESLSGVYAISENDLKATGKTYTFNFDPTNFIMFPEVLTSGSDGGVKSLHSLKELLSKIHLGGLPHSAQSMGVGSPASTVLKVSGS